MEDMREKIYDLERIGDMVRDIDEEELIDLAELFKVFADSTRIRILYGNMNE